MDIPVNYLAVLVCGISAMLIGSFWYGPVFGKIWMELSGIKTKDIKTAKKEGMAWRYLLNFISALVMAYILAHFLYYTNAKTILDAITAAFWLWLGFIATVSLGSVLWEGKSFKLYFLNNAYSVVSIFVMAMILVSWK